MKLYDVSDARPMIVRPGMNLTAFASISKPFELCNASLYNFTTYEPVGTIIEDSRFVHNQGYGYGVGIYDNKLFFGGPWDKTYTDFLTGYTGCVQNGQYVAPSFNDSYVFGCRLQRIAIGRKSGKPYIATDDNVTLREFSMNAISQGIDTLINLDGGGSRHLLYNGKAIYTSPRVPYNAFVFYKDAPVKPDGCPYPEPVRNLLMWCRGEDVKWLQWHLNKLGFRCGAIDGIFGWNTWNSVWNYQRTWSRVPDGICGPNTRGHLKNDV